VRCRQQRRTRLHPRIWRGDRGLLVPAAVLSRGRCSSADRAPSADAGGRCSALSSDALPRDCGGGPGGEFPTTWAQIPGDGARAGGARWWWGSDRHSPLPGRRRRRLGRSSATAG
jgi:hypothetical protein